jgi:hypothetical protein
MDPWTLGGALGRGRAWAPGRAERGIRSRRGRSVSMGPGREVRRSRCRLAITAAVAIEDALENHGSQVLQRRRR